MGKTTVVNIYRDEYEVYIGRAGKGKDGYFGNPYHTGDRDFILKQFKEYFYSRIKTDRTFAKRVLSLKGKTLGCFCSPKRCHGDIIADYLNNLPEIKPVKMAVIGTRGFSDYEYMKEILEWYDIKKIISGGAKGADRLAEQYASEKNIPIQIFEPQWDKFGKSAGYKRNIQIVDAADEIVAFWDQKSKGTGHSVKIAEEQGKPVYIYWPSCSIDDLRDKISDWGS